jgi:hypothetical protein
MVSAAHATIAGKGPDSEPGLRRCYQLQQSKAVPDQHDHTFGNSRSLLRSRSSYFVSESGNLLSLGGKSTLLNPDHGRRSLYSALFTDQPGFSSRLRRGTRFEKNKRRLAYFQSRQSFVPRKFLLRNYSKKMIKGWRRGSETAFAAIRPHHKEDLCRPLEANRRPAFPASL